MSTALICLVVGGAVCTINLIRERCGLPQIACCSWLQYKNIPPFTSRCKQFIRNGCREIEPTELSDVTQPRTRTLKQTVSLPTGHVLSGVRIEEF
jgi:hypothetical protein